jgi:HSP20 family protein
MAIVRYEGGGGYKNLFDELEDLVSSSFDLLNRQIGSTFPPIDIIEGDDEYLIRADLPGITKEEIQINIEKDVLTISGEKKRSIETPDKNRYYHFERGFGTFLRSLNLPSNVDPNKIEAHYSNGVLDIVLKKTQENKHKSVEIKVE